MGNLLTNSSENLAAQLKAQDQRIRELEAQLECSRPQKIRIFVKITNGRTITLDVEPSDTIKRVKQLIQEKEGIYPSNQILTYAGQALENAGTLRSYNIPNDSEIYLTVCSRPQKIRIFVKTLSGNKIKLEVNKFDNVARVKEIIYAKEDIPADQQRLICGGKQLEDNHTLEYYEIEEYMELYLIERLRGC